MSELVRRALTFTYKSYDGVLNLVFKPDGMVQNAFNPKLIPAMRFLEKLPCG